MPLTELTHYKSQYAAIYALFSYLSTDDTLLGCYGLDINLNLYFAAPCTSPIDFENFLQSENFLPIFTGRLADFDSFAYLSNIIAKPTLE